jgi:DNA repair protein RadA/Sms
MGKCPDCGEWNTLVEERIEPKARWTAQRIGDGTSSPKPLSEIVSSDESRMPTGWNEFDRVLGGGAVAGSIILIGGDPGIGKSTLLLQALHAFSAGPVLYVSGEESAAQIKMRADRLGIHSNRIVLLAETALEEMLRHAQQVAPAVMVVDSIQTVYTSRVSSAPGSVSQIREVASQLMFYAKQSGVTVFVVGHVTKDGSIAGPRVLEHIVDTVLYFEGDKSHSFRLLRAVKNRFGSVHELGVFEMKGSGLVGVENPSGLFLSERPEGASGSVVVATQEGTRPILVELQALVSPSYFGVARRMALGVDSNRVSLLLAILEKRAGLHLSGHDVFVNVIGGMEISEPAIDIGIAAAVASSFRERPIDPGMVVFGEIGLAGEIRGVQQAALRVREAHKMGFTRCLFPKRNETILKQEAAEIPLHCTGVSHLTEMLEQLF